MAGLWKPKWSRAFAVNNGPLVETCWHARWRSPYKHTTPHRLSSVDRPKRRQRRQRQRLRRRLPRPRRLVVMEGSYQDKSKAAVAAAAAVVVPSRATSNVTVAKPWRDLQLLEAGALRPFERPTNFTTALVMTSRRGNSHLATFLFALLMPLRVDHRRQSRVPPAFWVDARRTRTCCG